MALDWMKIIYIWTYIHTHTPTGAIYSCDIGTSFAIFVDFFYIIIIITIRRQRQYFACMHMLRVTTIINIDANNDNDNNNTRVGARIGQGQTICGIVVRGTSDTCICRSAPKGCVHAHMCSHHLSTTIQKRFRGKSS